jgi:hypothetical protein
MIIPHDCCSSVNSLLVLQTQKAGSSSRRWHPIDDSGGQHLVDADCGNRKNA